MNNYSQREINRFASLETQVNYGAELFKFALVVVIIGIAILVVAITS